MTTTALSDGRGAFSKVNERHPLRIDDRVVAKVISCSMTKKC